MAVRLGRVFLHSEYIVNLDDPQMVEEAKICLMEDVRDAIKYHEIHLWIDVAEAPDADRVDIPEFLRAEEEPPGLEYIGPDSIYYEDKLKDQQLEWPEIDQREEETDADL